MPFHDSFQRSPFCCSNAGLLQQLLLRDLLLQCSSCRRYCISKEKELALPIGEGGGGEEEEKAHLYFLVVGCREDGEHGMA